MRKYWLAFTNELQSEMEFRLDYFGELCIAALFLISSYFTWNEIFQTREIVAGFTREQILVYYLWSAFLVSTLWTYYNDESLSEEIQTGSLSQFITKPINYLVYRFCKLSAGVFSKAKFGILIFGLGGLYFNIQFWQIGLLQSVFFLFALFIAILHLYITNCIFNIIEFWMLGSWAARWVYLSIVSTLSGQLIPISFFPDYIQQVISYLPFNLYNGFLVEIITNKTTPDMLIWNFSKGIIWTVISLIFLNWYWKKGLRKFEAYGN